MRRSLASLTAAAAFASIAAYSHAQTTYTWDAPFEVDFSNPNNWDPPRTAPASDDILVFPSGGFAIEEGFEELHTFGRLVIESGATLFIQNSLDEVGGQPLDEGVIWLLTGGDDALVVEEDATLVLQGNRTFSIELGPGSSGYVEGEVQAYSRASGEPQALIASDPESLEFRDGAVFTLSPGTLPSGLLTTGAREGFSTSSDRETAIDSVHFLPGSEYYRGGLPDGTLTGGTGSTPLNFNQDPDIIIFHEGSSYIHLHGRISFSGRQWPNMIFREGRGRTFDDIHGEGDEIALGAGSGTPITVYGDVIFEPPTGPWIRDDKDILVSDYEWRVFGPNEEGTVATFIQGDFIVREDSVGIIRETGLPSTNVRFWDTWGDFIVEDPDLFEPVSAAQRRFRFNGPGPQVLDVNGLAFPRVDFSNPNGVTLESDVEFFRNVRFPEGPVFTNGHRFFVSEWESGGGDIIVASVLTEGTGYVNGTLERRVDAEDTGVRFFPVGNNSRTGLRLNITEAGTGFGSASVTIANSPPSFPAGFGPGGTVPHVWELETDGISGFTASVELNYDPDEIGALEEDNFVVGRYDGTDWELITNTDDSVLPYIEREPDENRITVHGLTDFSVFAIFDEEATAVPDWHLH